MKNKYDKIGRYSSINDIVNYETKYADYIFIDEAGRGCIGGELVFTGVKVLGDVSFADDSKKLSLKQRKYLVDKVISNVKYHTIITSAHEIDIIGLSLAIKTSLECIIAHFGTDEKYLYDGNNSFGITNPNFETLVKADALIKGVGAASIIAKHTKDSLMMVHHKEYPHYGFDKNAGYITKKHIWAIREYGYCEYHRKSYKIKEIEQSQNEEMTNFLF